MWITRWDGAIARDVRLTPEAALKEALTEFGKQFSAGRKTAAA